MASPPEWATSRHIRLNGGLVLQVGGKQDLRSFYDTVIQEIYLKAKVHLSSN